MFLIHDFSFENMGFMFVINLSIKPNRFRNIKSTSVGLGVHCSSSPMNRLPEAQPVGLIFTGTSWAATKPPVPTEYPEPVGLQDAVAPVGLLYNRTGWTADQPLVQPLPPNRLHIITTEPVGLQNLSFWKNVILVGFGRK